MIKIAICDDEKTVIDEIKKLVNESFAQEDECEIINFDNSKEFSLYYSKKNKADIIFMDIEIDDMSGLDLINKVRVFDDNVIVIFVTSHNTHVTEAFRLGAFQYISKPIVGKLFHRELRRAILSMNKHRKILRIEWQGEDKFIDIQDILYIESLNKKIAIYMEDNNVYEMTKQLSTICKELADYNFGQSHRSYIINLSKVFSVNANEVKLNNGTTVQVGRKFREEFKTKLNKYINMVEL